MDREEFTAIFLFLPPFPPIHTHTHTHTHTHSVNTIPPLPPPSQRTTEVRYQAAWRLNLKKVHEWP